MPHNRFFIPQLLVKDRSYFLQGDEMHHMKNVMRQKKGDQIELINGMGELATGFIQEIGKDKAQILVQDVVMQKEIPTRKVDIALSLIRLPRLEWAVEKLTELGITSITLFAAKRSEIDQLSDNKIERLQGLIVSALKQSGALFVPHLTIYPSLENIPFFDGTELYADFTEHLIEKPSGSCRLFIGPESGWSEQERAYLHKRCQCVRLAKNILRAETAAVAGACYLTNL